MKAPTFNPDVQAQREGYCVHDEATDMFACAVGDTVGPITMNRIASVGWCGPRGPVTVWASLASAISAAERLHGRVTTVPRFNGYCLEWREVT